MAYRQQVLALYRKIIKIGKTWEATNPAETEIERKYILETTREKFRQNKSEKDPEEILKFLNETEKRILIAQHYKNPYERPEYLPPATSYQVNVAQKQFKIRKPKIGKWIEGDDGK
uniref:Complex 1 LYR protein domain-containing protein n=1 Tax=Panagrolaimus sp. JU765 TaxID=591449 RepID=A0AC34PX68_9BILA